METSDLYRQEALLLEISRAVSDLRIGQPVLLLGAQKQAQLVMAAEHASDYTIERAELLGGAEAQLVLSATRARRLGIAVKPDKPVRIALKYIADKAARIALIDPCAADNTNAPNLLLPAILAEEKDATALSLVKLSGLLPAVIVVDMVVKKEEEMPHFPHILTVHAQGVLGYRDALARSLTPISRAHVPLHGISDVEVVAFRSPVATGEHLAIIVGTPSAVEAPLVRVHSSCMTGDILGSLRCDCGDQLRLALDTIAREGQGVVLYLNQEGRGIGISNKLRAYQLQDNGYDTVDANEEMGFAFDERYFLAAAEMLKKLGITSIRLMTNNPQKVEELKRDGINVTARVPHIIPARAENRSYLETKAKRCGHLM